MAGPEQYSLVEISEEGTLIKSTKIPCEIRVRTLLSSWFIAEKLLSHLAVDCDNVIIRSTSTRQPFTSSGLDARTGLFALSHEPHDLSNQKNPQYQAEIAE